MLRKLLVAVVPMVALAALGLSLTSSVSKAVAADKVVVAKEVKATHVADSRWGGFGGGRYCGSFGGFGGRYCGSFGGFGGRYCGSYGYFGGGRYCGYYGGFGGGYFCR